MVEIPCPRAHLSYGRQGAPEFAGDPPRECLQCFEDAQIAATGRASTSIRLSFPLPGRRYLQIGTGLAYAVNDRLQNLPVLPDLDRKFRQERSQRLLFVLIQKSFQKVDRE